jgi:hypothetical protein
MKTLLAVAMFVACVLLVSGFAEAVPYLDVLNYSQYMTIGSSHTFYFDLNNNALAAGDIGAEDVINSSLLGINFTDDEKDIWYNPLSYELALTIADDNIYIREIQTELWTANVLSQVQNDHTLSVTVASISGDFYLGNASLSGDYTDLSVNAAVTPEPATVTILGMGVLALLGFKIKKRI